MPAGEEQRTAVLRARQPEPLGRASALAAFSFVPWNFSPGEVRAVPGSLVSSVSGSPRFAQGSPQGRRTGGGSPEPPPLGSAEQWWELSMVSLMTLSSSSLVSDSDSCHQGWVSQI